MEVKKRYRFHLLSLAHLPVSDKYMSCAFTQKVIKMSKMLLSLGHETFIYGAEGSDVPCTKFIQTHTLQDIRDTWGEGDNRFEIGYDFKKKYGYKFDTQDPVSNTVLKMRQVAIDYINKNKKDDDFLLCAQGQYHKHIADKVGLILTCEPGIGYKNSFARFRAFESCFIQNFTYGMQSGGEYQDVRFLDRVIPNYFDPKYYPFRIEKEDYFLFIGRTIRHKGVLIAYEVAKKLGKKLIVAGQCAEDLTDDTIQHVGYAEPDVRANLMSKAKAVFVPTLYLEPFGGVAVEAQLCGTPVITTNQGVFPETVLQGETGFRCDTFSDFVKAAENVDKLNAFTIRRHAEQYLMDNVRWQYQKWFDEIYNFVQMVKSGDKEAWWKL